MSTLTSLEPDLSYILLQPKSKVQVNSTQVCIPAGEAGFANQIFFSFL